MDGPLDVGFIIHNSANWLDPITVNDILILCFYSLD